MNLKDNFDIYVGGKSGVFKGVRIDKKKCVMQNIQNLVSITDNDEVTGISWGDDEEKEVLVACGVKGVRSVKVYDTDCSTFTSSFFCNVGTGRITGISRYDEAILTAVHSGEVKLWRFKEEDGILLKAGKNLDKMCHSKINRNIIATGGQEHCLKLFDLERREPTFAEKNVPHDWLQLRVPIWISDIDFLPTTEQIVTVGRHGHIRLYDPKTQRRPVVNVEIVNEALTTLGVTSREKQIIVGSGKGRMNLIDLRKPATVLNTYKGFVGSVTGVACSKTDPYIVSVSLDRHLRVHHIDTKKLLKKVYLTSKMSCVLVRSEFSLPTDNETNGEITQNRMNKVTQKREKEENTGIVSDSDLEYDILFKKMQKVGNKEDRKKLIDKTREKIRNSEIVPKQSTAWKNENLEKPSKKLKKSNAST